MTHQSQGHHVLFVEDVIRVKEAEIVTIVIITMTQTLAIIILCCASVLGKDTNTLSGENVCSDQVKD